MHRGLVVTHNADKGNRRPERRKVHGHVGGPAGTIVVVVVLDDRDRRFGRQALHTTEQEMIQHHVANDDDAASGEVLYQRARTGLADGVSHCWCVRDERACGAALRRLAAP